MATFNRTHQGWVNPLEYGTALNSTTLGAALSIIGSDQRTLMLVGTDRVGTPTAWNLTSNVTIPANVTLLALGGCSLGIASGVTVTHKGKVEAPMTQWITVAGTGKLVLDGGTPEVYPQWWGGAGDGSTNNTPAFNAAIAALAGGGTIYFPASSGWYYFSSKPNPLFGGISVRGAGVSRSVLVRNYTEADVRNGFLDMDVATTGLANPCTISDIAIRAGNSTTGGSAINIESSSSVAQGDILLDNLYITGTGTFNYDVRVDGQEKSSAPEGVRSVHIRDSIFFQYTVAGVILLAFNNCSIFNTGIFDTAGTPSVASFVADGGAAVDANYLQAQLIFCPTARIGAVYTIAQVYFSSPNTTTLTTSSTCYNLTFTGNMATVVGEANTGSAGTGVSTGGAILAGKTVRTSGGAKLETADGLTFPPSPIASSNVHTMDGYLEGTFTPVLKGLTTEGAGTYSIQEGYYTKSGNIVALTIRLVWSAHTGTGNMIITGFPWSAITTGNYAAPLSVAYTGLTTGAGLALHLVLTGLQITFLADDPSGGANALVPMDTTGNLTIGGVYLTP